MRLGICIPIGERGSDRRARQYRQMREMAIVAEQGGADSVWVADHLFFRGDDDQDRGMWESMSVLAALAEATDRVELGPLVMCTPFRNPGMIAWAANTIDEISGGRFVLGMGAGWHAPEFEAFGSEFERRVSVFDESLQVIVPLLRDGSVDYTGQFVQGNAQLRPPGPRPQGPPILLAGTRPRMLSLIARWADRWNSVWYGMPTDEFRDERARLIEACQDAGRDPQGIEVSAGIVIQDPAVDANNSPEAISGTVERIAEGLEAWREEGVAEVMCRMEPPSIELVETITRAARQIA